MFHKLVVSLTFDDGHLNHVNIARELNHYGIHATFFITTNIKSRNFISNKLKAIKIIASLGHEVGSHSVSHRRLTELPHNELVYEVKESKEILEKLLGKRIYGFAYPYYAHNLNVVRIVMNYYDYARNGPNPYDLFNMHIYDDQIAKYLISSISPTYDISISKIIKFLKIRLGYHKNINTNFGYINFISNYINNYTVNINNINSNYRWLVFTLHNEPINYILHIVKALRMIGSMFGIKVEFKAMCEVLFGEECLE